MRRSGSTLLANTLRQAIELSGHSLYTKYIKDREDYDPVIDYDYEVLKFHSFNPEFYMHANPTFTMARDLRDMAASAIAFGMCDDSPEGAVAFIGNCLVREYNPWSRVTWMEIPYERFMEDPVRVTTVLCDRIGLEEIDSEEVCNRVAKLPESKLSGQHRTSAKVTPSVRDAIEKTFGKWLYEHGYR